MSTHFDHFGGQDAGRTVEGGKRFVQLSHMTADGWLPLNQHDLEALVGDIEGGLHPCDATSNNQRDRDHMRFYLSSC